jgi:hypothetical protein
MIGGVAVNFHGIVRAKTPATLSQMKRSTVRPIDHADAARLAEAFDLGEEPR